MFSVRLESLFLCLGVVSSEEEEDVRMKIELDYRKSTIGGACKDTHLAEFGFGLVLHSTVHSDLNKFIHIYTSGNVGRPTATLCATDLSRRGTFCKSFPSACGQRCS